MHENRKILANSRIPSNLAPHLHLQSLTTLELITSLTESPKPQRDDRYSAPIPDQKIHQI